MESLARRIEEVSLNAQPALQTVLCDGWVLRFASGYSKRANSVNPLYPSSRPVVEKIAECERRYAEQHLPALFKLTPCAQPAGLDEQLAHRGYMETGRTSVQTRPLYGLPVPRGDSGVQLYQELDPDWLESFCTLNGVSLENRSVLERMLINIKARTGFMRLTRDDEVVACGLGVVEEGYLGLFDIVTHPEQRGKGFGTELVSNLLHWGRESGADVAYLQVVAANAPAVALYAKLGFREAYPYWYRVKPS